MKILVETSARHVHVTKEDLEKLEEYTKYMEELGSGE